MLDQNYYIVRKEPEKFNPVFNATGCCCVYQGKILFLKRHPQKPHGNTWGVPGGKIEKNEPIRDAVIREIHEEAGLDIDQSDLQLMGTFYCSIPGNFEPLRYTFHLYLKKFIELPALNIGQEEHTDAKWVTPSEAFQLPLIVGAKEILDFFIDFNHINS